MTGAATVRGPAGRARGSVLARLHPAALWRAAMRRRAVRRARKLARAGVDAGTIARRTGLAEDLVRIVVARG